LLFIESPFAVGHRGLDFQAPGFGIQYDRLHFGFIAAGVHGAHQLAVVIVDQQADAGGFGTGTQLARPGTFGRVARLRRQRGGQTECCEEHQQAGEHR
jgi:hypothetical protein